MLTPNDIETQLTQRRLDTDALLLNNKQQQVQINELKRKLEDLKTNVESKPAAPSAPIIQGIVNGIGPNVTVFIKATFKKIVNFLDKVGISTAQTPTSNLQVNDIADGQTYSPEAAVTISPTADDKVGLRLRPHTDSGQTGNLLEINWGGSLQSYINAVGDFLLHRVLLANGSYGMADGSAVAFGPYTDIAGWSNGIFINGAKIAFKIGGTTIAEFDGANLGIGKVPAKPLDVNGDGAVSGAFHVGGNFDATGTGQFGSNINTDGIYKILGLDGVSNAINITVGTAVIQYKDHSNANQTVTVVTSVTIDTNIFTGGIKTI